MSAPQRKIQRIRREEATLVGPSVLERMTSGKSLRERVPRTSHAEWTASPGRPDPIGLLQGTDNGRLPELLPMCEEAVHQGYYAYWFPVHGNETIEMAKG